MLDKRIVLIGLLVVVGLSLWPSGVLPSRAAKTQDTGQPDSVLLEEIRGLRTDIAALRSEIKELRAELGGETPATTGQRSGDEASGLHASVCGEWKEHWGTPGQTDVTYNDGYRITRTTDGKVKVVITTRNQAIWDERLDQDLLTFTQRTDAYVVKYSLRLQSDGEWMLGTATTPYKVVSVKWERTK